MARRMPISVVRSLTVTIMIFDTPIAPANSVHEAIQAVGKAGGVIYIFDLARTPIPYVSSESVDVTAKVKTQLGIK